MSGPQIEIPVNKYFPMKVGNYWVYEFINRLPDGSSTGSPFYDTLKIVSDTLINEQLFYLFSTNKPTPSTQYLNTDSSGYIINQFGNISLLPSANEALYNFHYGFVGSDTAYSYWEEFQDGFVASNQTGTYNCLAKIASHQAWPNFGGGMATDTLLYSEIGMIQRSYSYLSGSKMIGVLIDYHLEE